MKTKLRSERSIKKHLKGLINHKEDLWEEVKDGEDKENLRFILLYRIANVEEEIKLLEWVLGIR